MTTMNIEDISKKRVVPNKYKPNSYRIFCEDIGNQSIPEDQKYFSQAPAIYTDPMIVPAQAIEDRNRPHAGRLTNFLRENPHTLNEPINRVSSKNLDKETEKRWWEWNLPAEDAESNWKNKRRSASQSGPNQNSNGSEFQTTYQKEHGYLKKLLQNDNQSANSANNRHSFNPNTGQAVGIVPVNDLSSYTKANEPQRVFVDRVSFEQNYDSRNDANYPARGKRHGAFVMDQVEPKPFVGTQVRPDSNKGTSVWDVMHPSDAPLGNPVARTEIYRKTSGSHPDSRNQRRDPIGYFEDTKFGGSLGSQFQNGNPGPNFNPNLKANTHEPYPAPYQPSWTNGSNSEDANELLDKAMMYQRPIAANGNGQYPN